MAKKQANAKKKVTTADVKWVVIECILAEARRNNAHINKPTKYYRLEAGDTALKLGDDLDIAQPRREALHQAYSGISQGIHGGKAISPGQAGAATTVAKAIKLVADASN